ncbi:MAG: ribosome assembly RNA-binding protein YhbY [Fusobacteria bacterium]|nr:ribosome assembly RNA-binding protein YhbY [Fusobacteriota bacterium]
MLTGKEKRYLRGLASLLNPVVIIGKEGIGEQIIAEIANGINVNELVKIKVGKNSPEEISEIVKILEDNELGEVVQIIGRNVVLYKKNKKEPKINLP